MNLQRLSFSFDQRQSNNDLLLLKEKIAKRKRQRELQEQTEGLDGARMNDMGDGINDLEREEGDKETGEDNFMMINSHFQAKIFPCYGNGSCLSL